MKLIRLCPIRGVPVSSLVLALALGVSLICAPARAREPLEWTRQGLAIGGLTQIEHGNGLWIACGDRGVAVSSDAQRWEVVLDPVLDTRRRAVHYGGGVWVAVGQAGFLATSSDGRKWRSRDLGDSRCDLKAVAYENGVWVAVGASEEAVLDGYGPALYWSIDGLSWIQEVIPNVGELTGIHHANGTWLALGRGGFVTSSDGRHWVSHQLGAEGGQTYAAAYGSGTWLVLDSYQLPSGGLSLRLWRSVDLQHWAFSESEPLALPCVEWGGGSLHYANGVWLLGLNYLERTNASSQAQGHRTVGRLWALSDGRPWTLVHTGGFVADVTCSDGVWIAVGESILTSTDLRTWNTADTGWSAEFSQVRFAADTWVAIGRSSPSVHVARSSESKYAVMEIRRDPEGRGVEASCRGPRNCVYRLQRSEDLRQWTDLAVAHQYLATYLVPHSQSRQFYRTLLSILTSDDDWKNQITAVGASEGAGEPFLSPRVENPRTVSAG